jgi:hypothetical protein
VSRAAIAWVVCALCSLVALAMVALGLFAEGITDPGDRFGAVAIALPMIAYPLVGALVIARRGSPMGWVFSVTGAVLSLDWAGSELANYALLERPGAIPGGTAFAAVSSAAQVPAFCLFGCVLLLFPSGSVHSRRERITLRALIGAAVAGVLAYGLGEGAFEEPFQRFDNPIGVPGTHAVFSTIAGLSWFVCLLAVSAAAISLVRRLRRSTGVERLQLKWMVYAGAVLAAVFLVVFPTFFVDDPPETVKSLRDNAFTLAIAGIPVAAGIAILRHRLYDIDVVINRTLVYGSLTAMLAATYLGSVLLLQLALDPITSGSSLAVAVSTLAVAALVRPARARIQAVVDRRFYRRRYDAARTLEGFSARMREQVDLEALGGELREVVRETMQPEHVSLWLRRERGAP